MENNLLERGAPITMEELQEIFHARDFSAMTSGYDPAKATPAKNAMYLKIKKLFRTAWMEQMGLLTKTKTLRNFSSNSPIGCLEESEEKLVAGTVMELVANEEHCTFLLDQVFESMQEHILAEVIKVAEATGKPAEELTDQEIHYALNTFADEFLARMMNLLLRVQEVPMLLDFMADSPATEDFDEGIFQNHDKIDFERQWYHLRTKIGNLLSLTPEMMEETPEDISDMATEAIDLGMTPVKTTEEVYRQLLRAFIDSLDDDIDRQIIFLRDQGATQEEIAAALGYANHSAVAKRMKRLKEKFHVFMDKLHGK